MADDEAVKAACRLPRQSKTAILSCYRKAKAKGVLRPYVTVAVECGVPLDVVASCVGQFLRDDDARSVISLATAADSVIDTSTLPTTLLPSWKRQWEEQVDEREEEWERILEENRLAIRAATGRAVAPRHSRNIPYFKHSIKIENKAHRIPPYFFWGMTQKNLKGTRLEP